MDEIISIEKFKTIVAENSKKNGTWVRSEPNDIVTKFWDYESIISAMPSDWIDDLCGFVKSKGIGYEPRFSTHQKDWDESLKSFNEDKERWCAKYGCE